MNIEINSRDAHTAWSIETCVWWFCLGLVAEALAAVFGS